MPSSEGDIEVGILTPRVCDVVNLRYLGMVIIHTLGTGKYKREPSYAAAACNFRRSVPYDKFVG